MYLVDRNSLFRAILPMSSRHVSESTAGSTLSEIAIQGIDLSNETSQGQYTGLTRFLCAPDIHRYSVIGLA